jgi:hypothetical protein
VDAIVVKIRDGQVTNRPVYVAIGVTVNGERDILGLWAGDGSEGAKFWLSVLTEIKNRGVEDVCILVCDGLKGLPDSVTTVWPLTTVQACLLHLIRNTFRYASRRDWDAIGRQLRPIYTAPTAAAAGDRFAEFAEAWGGQYPAVIKLWQSAWEEFIPFLDYGARRGLACGVPGRPLVSAVFGGLRFWCPGRMPGGRQVAAARWIFRRLEAVAASWSSLSAAFRPRRENRSRMVLRLPMAGSTVAPRRL